MKTLTSGSAVTTRSDKKRCIINIFVPKDGEPMVRSIELSASGGRNRTSFTSLLRLHEVFEDGIASALEGQVRKLSKTARAMSLPDQVIETQGLILAGIHLMSTYAADGSASIIVRFKQMIGHLHYAFLSGVGFGVPISETRDEVALKVLTDISLPLLNICAAADANSDDPISAADTTYCRHILDRAEEIRFHVELVKRYLSGLDQQVFPVLAPSQHLLNYDG